MQTMAGRALPARGERDSSLYSVKVCGRHVPARTGERQTRTESGFQAERARMPGEASNERSLDRYRSGHLPSAPAVVVI